MSWSEKATAAEALLVLIGSSICIRCLPFAVVLKIASSINPGALRSDWNDFEQANRVRMAVEAWARRVPWKALCFQRGLTTHLMLRRRGVASVLHYGVSQSEEDGLEAHVWITAGYHTVIGHDPDGRFTRLLSCPAPNVSP